MLGIVAYLTNVGSYKPIPSERSNKGTTDTPPTVQAVEKPARGISSVDRLSNITREPTPAGWTDYSNGALKTSLSHPTNWMTDSVDNISPTGKQYSFDIILSANPKSEVERCVLEIKNVSFAVSVKNLESTDKNDPGTIDPNAMVIWRDIKERDDLILNGNTAFRYLMSRRDAARQEAQVSVIYMIDSQNKTYELSCPIQGEITEQVVDKIAQQTIIN